MLGNRLIQGIVRLLKNLFRMSPGTSAGSSRFPQSDVRPSESLSTFVFRTEQIVSMLRNQSRSRPGRPYSPTFPTMTC